MKVLGNIDVDLDVVNKDYVDGEIKNNLNNYVPLTTYEDFTKTNDLKYNDLLEDLSNYATKDDLASVDVSGQLKDYVKNNYFEEVVGGLQKSFSETYGNQFLSLNSQIYSVKKLAAGKASIDQFINLETRLNEISKMEGPKGADGTSVTTWTGTESQYNALSTKSSTTLYIITE